MIVHKLYITVQTKLPLGSLFSLVGFCNLSLYITFISFYRIILNLFMYFIALYCISYLLLSYFIVFPFINYVILFQKHLQFSLKVYLVYLLLFNLFDVTTTASALYIYSSTVKLASLQASHSWSQHLQSCRCIVVYFSISCYGSIMWDSF